MGVWRAGSGMFSALKKPEEFPEKNRVQAFG
jgi:hypothetical protein